MSKNLRNSVIEYVERYVQEEGIILPVMKSRNIINNHTKRYHNCLYLLAGVGGCARDLMDYLTERMDANNLVRNDIEFRREFIDFIDSITKGEIKYKDRTVKDGFETLKKKTLILPKSKGIYKVNPEYFVKNNDGSREKMIKIELEFQRGKNTKIKVIKGITSV